MDKGEIENKERLRLLTYNLERGTLKQIRRMVNELHPADIARLLESLPLKQRFLVWNTVGHDLDGDVLLHVNDEVRAGLIEKTDSHELVAAMETLDMDDLADILFELPLTVVNRVLSSMDEQDRRRFEHVLTYPKDTAGGLMNTDTVTIRPDVSLDVVSRYLRFKGKIPDMTDRLIVVNRFDKYLGLLPITDLLTKDPELTVAEILDRDVEAISATTPAKEVASMFEDFDLISAPVVNENGILLGRITIDDVVDVIREKHEQDMMNRAGVGREDMFGSVLKSVKGRSPWLGINLLTAIMASGVIGLFQGAIEKVVALAILMPIIASMGGIAGSQTLTLAVRGIALGEISSTNAKWLLIKEVSVGLFNGIIWAVVMGAVALLWFNNTALALLAASAILINLICAALVGATVPMGLKRMGVDPAIAGGVVLTTITDIVGFFTFLGLAALSLM